MFSCITLLFRGFYAYLCRRSETSVETLVEPTSQLSFLDCELAPPLAPSPWIGQQPIANAGSSNWTSKPRIDTARWVELDAAVALSQLASSATGCPPLANPLSLQSSGHQLAGQPPTCTWYIYSQEEAVCSDDIQFMPSQSYRTH